MPIANATISETFDRLADLLEIEGANPFRVRAYRNAARVVMVWPHRMSAVLKTGELPKIPGVGKDLAEKIKEVALTGKLGLLDEVERRVPRELSTLLKIPGLGPKRVLAVRNKLGVKSLPELEKAAITGKIQELPGFGAKIEKSILDELHRTRGLVRRFKYAAVEQVADSLMAYLREDSNLKKIIAAGSFRRKTETVGDLDLLATCRDATKLMKRFTTYEDVEKILATGETKSSILLGSGLQVDLRVVEDRSYGSALHYFTGSKNHNIAIRTMGVRKKLKINEYGVFKGKRWLAGRTEEEVYARVGLPYIEPELRENRGEIEAAQEGRLPQLIRQSDIRGDLHAHTKATDGRMSIEEMAEAAQARGYEYLAITDHSQHLTVASGLKPSDLRKQIARIDKINAKLKGFRILKSIEVDILENGKLDLPREVLEDLDLCVCSVHFKFNLSEAKQTERIIRAMDHPCFDILGHPSGRLIEAREPYRVDMERLIRAAAERGCAMELNGQPDRLDLTDVDCKSAKEAGVKIAISTDAHSVQDLDLMRFGIGQARRGWLEAKDVINTSSLRRLAKVLRPRRRALCMS